MTTRVLAFDVGGVLSDNGPDLAAVAQVLCGPQARPTDEQVSAAIWAPRDDYDLGISDVDYWSAVSTHLGVSAPSPAVVARLVLHDATRWASPAAGIPELLTALARHGVPTAVLSNAPRPLAEVFNAADWTKTLGPRTFSCDTGYVKPDPRSYAALLASVAAAPSSVVFVDDRPVNVAAAREVGLDARLWQGPATVADLLG